MLENILIRPITQSQDSAIVFDLFKRAADYVMLEDGNAPDLAKVDAFFTDVVPGGDLSQSVKLGAEMGGRLYGIVDMGFGYPDVDDAYIGLLILDPAVRGQGLGHKILAQLTQVARARGAKRQLVAALEANLRGYAFWQRQGFVTEQVFEPRQDDPLQHRRFRMARAL